MNVTAIGPDEGDGYFFFGVGLSRVVAPRGCHLEDTWLASWRRRLRAAGQEGRLDGLCLLQADTRMVATDPGVIDQFVRTMVRTLATARIVCPSEPDPDLPAVGDRVVPFEVRDAETPFGPLLSGRVDAEWRDAWDKSGLALYDAHLWTRSPDHRVERFRAVAVLVGRDGPIGPPIVRDRPLIVSAPYADNPGCRYAQVHADENPAEADHDGQT